MIVNLALIKHPMNWAMIIMMLLVAAIAGHLMLSYVGVEPKTS